MSARPRLLFLCQTLPYPPDGGVWIRTYHVLRLLSRAFDITALCFERTPMGGADPARLTETGVEALRRFADVEVFPIPQRHSRTRFVWDHLRSVARHRVYTTYRYESQPFAARLLEILRSRDIDLIHVDSLDLVRHLTACGDRPVVCVHHDVTSMQLARRAGIENAEWRRAYLRHQARLTEQSEREWCGRVALNVAVSADDAAALDAYFAVCTRGDRAERRGRRRVPARRLHGTRRRLRRRPALVSQRGRASIFRGRHPAAPARTAAGRACGVDRQRDRGTAAGYAEQFGIDVTGYLDDVRPHMRDAACHIVPLRAGGGTRLKILNSWAMGKPVVSTAIGCEGLDAIDGENILIRDDPKAFAKAVLTVLEDTALARRIGDAGRATAERQYSWDVIGRGLIERYLEVIHVDHRAAAVSAITAAAR